MLFNTSSKFTIAYRLLRKDRFDHVVKAEKIFDRYFKVCFVNNEENHARIGIIVSKKTLASAANRNCVKRVIRETFRQHTIRNYPIDLVVMVRCALPQEINTQYKSLKMLFSQIENKCGK